ncbi:arabinogalactan endo-1,4-beta-galactosidase [Sphingomonas sp. SM33]|uniref:Arabinogalactan endo-beta-1,4-galactanase n=1 Tax=Sphingomonas telluris TaxID=2907998 RepID=A0ABS9VJ00_9SPHN|nr:arabinogalactan endo-1,4-beta-galactosidase [Sphingomonas telluris]MCH8614945.1 arabinogalactan endo-1,4-beta-galactosidase [Sphingomonas telluris]
MKVRILSALAALSAAVAPSQLLAAQPGLYLGADLSYVNEMEDCGAVYRLKGKPIDPFVLLKKEGGNLVRVRIWVDPTWTKYSNYDDVLKTIRRAHAAGLQALLDFHYSDDWADGGKQLTPAAWAKLSTDDQVKALYDYTLDTLRKLDADKAMPEMVQVGNETNPELLGGKVPGPPINWERNARLLNAGIQAVQEAGRSSSKMPRIMLHIAQPENVLPWFDAATKFGVTGYDLIGISYYKKWSTYSPDQLKATIAETKSRYGKDVIVVETGYPFTLEGADTASNLLGTDGLVPGYPATPEGQRKFMIDLTQLTLDAGGIGVVYWEPYWVSTKCGTRWGKGSDWENAAWFDYKNHDALPVFEWLRHNYRLPKTR